MNFQETSYLDMANGQIGSSLELRVKKRVILSWLEMGWVNWIVDRVELTRIFHMIFFLLSKLLYVKCIILNSPLISRISLAKHINTYSIILKLYKSQNYKLKQNSTKDK